MRPAFKTDAEVVVIEVPDELSEIPCLRECPRQTRLLFPGMRHGIKKFRLGPDGSAVKDLVDAVARHEERKIRPSAPAEFRDQSSLKPRPYRPVMVGGILRVKRGVLMVGMEIRIFL